jgi:hypothetical protein
LADVIGTIINGSNIVALNAAIVLQQVDPSDVVSDYEGSTTVRPDTDLPLLGTTCALALSDWRNRYIIISSLVYDGKGSLVLRFRTSGPFAS